MVKKTHALLQQNALRRPLSVSPGERGQPETGPSLVGSAETAIAVEEGEKKSWSLLMPHQVKKKQIGEHNSEKNRSRDRSRAVFTGT